MQEYTVNRVSMFDPELLRYKTVEEFLESARMGSEIVIEWKGIEYGIVYLRNIVPKLETDKGYSIAQCGSKEISIATEMQCDTPEELLEYSLGGDRLGDVITQVTVSERTF